MDKSQIVSTEDSLAAAGNRVSVGTADVILLEAGKAHVPVAGKILLAGKEIVTVGIGGVAEVGGIVAVEGIVDTLEVVYGAFEHHGGNLEEQVRCCSDDVHRVAQRHNGSESWGYDCRYVVACVADDQNGTEVDTD